MYPSVRDLPGQVTAARQEVERADGTPGGRIRNGVGGTVLALGAVSFFTDISSEMVTAVLPVYLTIVVGLGPLGYGVLDGLYQGVTVLVRLLGGYVADRFRRPKAIAQVGYGLSAVCKLGLLAAGTGSGIGAVLAVDRTGKGLRTAPRDALISAATSPHFLGRAFGVHRAWDTAGAMLGPLAAFGLLLYLPGHYDGVFLMSFVVAVIGCAVLWSFVRERPPAPDRPPLRVQALGGLLTDRSMRRLTLVSGVLGLLTVSDGFLYLLLRDRGAVDLRFFPLLFVGTALIYLVLAVPLGGLADCVGRVPVLVGGHVALLGVYVALIAGDALSGAALWLTVLTGLGTYYAATDGVLAALASTLTPPEMRGSGIALVQTAVAVGRLGSALLFGLAWSAWDRHAALLCFTLALATGTAGAGRLLRSRPAGERSGVSA